MPTEARSADRTSLFTVVRGGVGVAVRLTPRARREQVIGLDRKAPPRCRIAVKAAPVDGQANAALLKLLAKEWSVPKSSLSITVGAGGRDKVVHVAGDPEALLHRLRAWAERAHG